MEANDLRNCDYVEPFAGGAGVALQLLVTNSVPRIHLNDSSYPIFALWNSILTKPEEFCRRILSASLTVDEWKRHREVLRADRNADEFDLGFSTFFLNRCNRSGVLSGGVIGGLDQTGKWKIDARFTRTDLVRRVEIVAENADRICVSNLDAEIYLTEYLPRIEHQCLVYCDPPYIEKSRRLYLDNYKKDGHESLARLIQGKLTQPWVVSYDNAPEIAELYGQRKCFTYDLQYSASKAVLGKEVFVVSDDLKLPPSSSIESINTALKQVVA